MTLARPIMILTGRLLVALSVTALVVAAPPGRAAAAPPNFTARSWGDNEHGQLGIGVAGADHPVAEPTLVPGVAFVAVSAGAYHTLALTSTGAVYAWGRNDSGQLGLADGLRADHATPVPVVLPAGVTFVAVAAGYDHSLAMAADGRVYSWGGNGRGQLGRPAPDPTDSPGVVPGTYLGISAGDHFSLAVDTAQAGWAWGDNDHGQLGIGGTSAQPRPFPVAGGLTFRALSAGAAHALALTTDGLTYAWGRGASGELGRGGDHADRSAPVLVATDGITFTALAAGAGHSLGLTADGTAYAWGDNTTGQLGDGTTAARDRPTAVATDLRFTEIEAGYRHSLARTAAGAVVAWGDNVAGKLGVGDEEPRLVPTEAVRPPAVRFTAVAGGLDHTVALTGEPVTLAATAGDSQSTVVGAGFAGPLAVTVLDAGRLAPPVSGFTNGIGFGLGFGFHRMAAAGNPVAGVPVTFEVTAGPATFTVAVPPAPGAAPRPARAGGSAWSRSRTRPASRPRPSSSPARPPARSW